MDDLSWPSPATILDDLPDDLRARIKGELAPGERLLWAAKAVPRAWEKGTNYPAMLLFAGGFATLGALCIGAFFGPLAARLRGVEGLLFVAGLVAGFVAFCILATIFATIGGQSWQALKGRRDVAKAYALTDRRAIIWAPVVDSEAITVWSYPRRQAGQVHRVEFPDGSGDVGVDAPKGAKGDVSWDSLKFEGVADVRRVEALVRATLIGHDPVTLVPEPPRPTFLEGPSTHERQPSQYLPEAAQRRLAGRGRQGRRVRAGDPPRHHARPDRRGRGRRREVRRRRPLPVRPPRRHRRLPRRPQNPRRQGPLARPDDRHGRRPRLAPHRRRVGDGRGRGPQTSS